MAVKKPLESKYCCVAKSLRGHTHAHMHARVYEDMDTHSTDKHTRLLTRAHAHARAHTHVERYCFCV